jgi:hypothetical protein
LGRLARSYNPGRGTRWGTARDRPLHGLVKLGATQKVTLPWKRHPTRISEMNQLQQAQVMHLVSTYPASNQLRTEGGRLTWYLRAPEGFLTEESGVDLPPENDSPVHHQD